MRHLALVVAGLLFATPAAAKPTLVVAPLQSDPEDARDARSLSRFLRTTVGQTNAYTLVTPEDMGAIDEELKRQLSGGCAETSCIADIGGALGAQFMITGSLDRLGRRYILNLKLIDIEQVRAVKTIAVQARSTEAFADLLPSKVANLLGQRGVRSQANQANTQTSRSRRTPKPSPTRRPASLGFFGHPAGAKISIRGPGKYKEELMLGDKPLKKLSPGVYRWRAKQDGYETATGQVAIGRSSGPKTVKIKLRALGTLRMEGELESAKIRIKGPRSFGVPDQMPFISEGLPSGTYTVHVTRDGYEPFVKTAVVTLERETRLFIKLRELGKLKIDGAISTAKITINGPVTFEPTDELPFISDPLPSGSYVIKAEAGGYVTWTQKVAISPAKQTSVMIQMVTLQEAAKRKRLNLKMAAGTAVAIGSILGATNHMREVKHEWNQGMALTADLLTLTGVAVLAWSW